LFVAAFAHLFHELGDLFVAGASLVVTSLAALALGAAACENLYQQTLSSDWVRVGSELTDLEQLTMVFVAPLDMLTKAAELVSFVGQRRLADRTVMD
jgi:hypothetical protein